MENVPSVSAFLQKCTMDWGIACDMLPPASTTEEATTVEDNGGMYSIKVHNSTSYFHAFQC